MQNYFNELADHVQSRLKGNEVTLTSFRGEDSDFVRMNKNEIRQAGNVAQRTMLVDLIDGQRHATGTTTLTGEKEMDQSRLTRLVENLREKLPHLPEDPYLLYNTEVKSSERHGEDKLPPRTDAVESIRKSGAGKDLVGIYAAGGIYSGFANSLGQRNWYSTYSFNLDWSVYYQTDKAVKSGYGGFEWDTSVLDTKMETATEQLSVLAKSPKTIDPGRYRVYLSPVALNDIIDTISWEGFGLKDHKTKQTTLLRMVEQDVKLHPRVSLAENTSEGIAPNFQSAGYIKPSSVSLIEGGCFRNCLTSPRSAKEYGVPTNGASGGEAPESIDMGAGDLPQTEVLDALGTGLYINNLWYLNFSDRSNCRITGMTRFATLWVENGKIVAPVNVMRFDETVYRMLGENLDRLTAERDMILSADTYDARSTASARLPGAIVDQFNLTL